MLFSILFHASPRWEVIFWGHHEKRTTAGSKEVRRRALRRREPLGTVSSRVAVGPSNNRNFTNTENTAIQYYSMLFRSFQIAMGLPVSPTPQAGSLHFMGNIDMLVYTQNPNCWWTIWVYCCLDLEISPPNWLKTYLHNSLNAKNQPHWISWYVTNTVDYGMS